MKIKSHLIAIGLTLLSGLISWVDAKEVKLTSNPTSPKATFALGDITKQLTTKGHQVSLDQKHQVHITLTTISDKELPATLRPLKELLKPEGFAIRKQIKDNISEITVIGADEIGLMYGGLELAEIISMKGLDAIQDDLQNPYINKRGLKVNVPLDARTPAYADCGDAAQKNMAVMWDLDFWKAHLDQMARHRYNSITMWNAHPFPSMVKVPEYPDVALEDVKIADIDWREWFPKYAGRGGALGVTPEILNNLKTIKKMSMDEKIAHWQAVMQYAHDRGIEVHMITWNIFVWGTDEKYGITHNIKNEVTIDYLRKSVRSLFETYPLLAGIGVTAGERMVGLTPDEKEQWLWKTYGLGVMDAKQAFPDRKIRFIHRYWLSKIPEITKHFEGFDEDIHPKGTKWWWNLRNDDIFYFRWGDPDFVRQFIEQLPPPEQTEGFHMGSDGYVWGREFVSTDPDSPRQLEINKHWYKFMLWGRLGYNPKLSNTFFETALQQRFPGKPTKKLQAVWSRSSKIIPCVNREHWHNWDFQWSVETCNSRNGYHAITDKSWKPGGIKVANEIEEHSTFVLKGLIELKQVEGDKHWRRTLGDIEAMAHLGNYYAEKIRAAHFKKKKPQQAITHLEIAAEHWKKYATVGAAQYKPQLLSKGGIADWNEGYQNALKDIQLIKNKPKN